MRYKIITTNSPAIVRKVILWCKLRFCWHTLLFQISCISKQISLKRKKIIEVKTDFLKVTQINKEICNKKPKEIIMLKVVNPPVYITKYFAIETQRNYREFKVAVF